MLELSNRSALPDPVARAVRALAEGEPILLFDARDREGETDLVILSERATPGLVRLLRQDAGGLICTAISHELKEALGLPYAAELLAEGVRRYPALSAIARGEPRYDRRSAFGITVNHRSNYTGVPDNDRASTIRALGDLAREAGRFRPEELRERFAAEFSSPGHVPLLYSAPGLLRERKGHTELAISLARMGSLSESATVCEMLGDSGGARSIEAARRYARDHGWNLLEGIAVTEAFDRWSA